MEIQPITPQIQEGRRIGSKEDAPPKQAASPQADPSDGTASTPEKVGAALGASDIMEFTERMAEILNEAMRAMKFSISFQPDTERGMSTVFVRDDEGNLIRTIPLSEFVSISRRITEGVLNGGILTDRVVS